MSKTIFITGATSGIGKAIALRFAQEGHTIIAAGRRADRLDVLEEELSQWGSTVYTIELDVRDREAVEAGLEQVLREVPVIDILVNNAGLAAGMAPIDEGNVDDWEQMIDTNIKGLLYVTRKIAPKMREQRSGHIINIGSTAGKTAYKNGNVYCATKFAVDALTQSMRIDLLPYGIKVTAINPGMTETEFSTVRFKGDAARAAFVYSGLKALQAADIAETVFYCASLPKHVCINDLTITCTNQANSIYSIKDADKA